MYEEKSKEILYMKDRVLCNKTIPLVKVLWEHHGVEEASWELELDMRKKYPELFIGFFFLISRTKVFLGGGNLIPNTNKISKYDYHNIFILFILTKYVQIEA